MTGSFDKMLDDCANGKRLGPMMTWYEEVMQDKASRDE